MEKEGEGSEDFFEPAENAPQKTTGKSFPDREFDASDESEVSDEPTGQEHVAGGDERRMVDEPAGGSTRPASETAED